MKKSLYPHFLACALSFGIIACGGHESTSPKQLAETPQSQALVDTILKPVPGAKLSGPVAKPVKQKSKPQSPPPLEFGADRPVVKIDAPKPPKGGAVSFTFGDQKRGWIASIPEGIQVPAVAYGDGRVYVSGGFESYSFYALDAEDGHIDWATKNLEDDGPTSPIYYDDRVIFNTESCTLFVVDAVSGQRLWYRFLGDPTLAQVAASDGLIIASHPGDSGYPEVSAYKIENGNQAWTKQVDGEILATPVIDGDTVYFSTITGKLYALELKTGKKLWSEQINATTAPWVEGEELHVTHKEKAEKGKEPQESMVVLSAKDGSLLRTHTTVNAKYVSDVPRNLNDWKKVWVFEGSRPVVADGVRYAAMGNIIEASDPQSGETFWTRKLNSDEKGRLLSSVAVAGPEVVFSTRTGQLFGLDVDTGYTLFSYDLGKKVAAEPVIANGWIYAATTDGYVMALQVGDTTLDGWHMFGGNPQHNGKNQANEQTLGTKKKVIGPVYQNSYYKYPKPSYYPEPIMDPF
jgi:Ca-activated chloride channel family protein